MYSLKKILVLTFTALVIPICQADPKTNFTKKSEKPHHNIQKVREYRKKNKLPMPSLWTGKTPKPEPVKFLPSKKEKLKINTQTIQPPSDYLPPAEYPERQQPLPPDQKNTTDSSNRIAIVIPESLYEQTQNSIQTFAADLQFVNCQPIIITTAGIDAPQLRQTLIDLYNQSDSLDGAVLIGDLPYIRYEMNEDWGSGSSYTIFTCDLYFMDTTGSWHDWCTYKDQGVIDTWVDPEKKLEIWVSRIKTDNLSNIGTEDQLIRDYFKRNRLLRFNILNSNHSAMVYDDDDWAFMSSTDSSYLEPIFSSQNVTALGTPEQTTANDYKSNQIPDNYQLIMLRSHGATSEHGFYEQERSTYKRIFNNDYISLDNNTCFYSLFVCTASDFTIPNNMASTIVMNPNGAALLAWGSTKTGGMYGENIFYQQLQNGKSFGQAFIYWFNNTAIDPKWHYGQVLIGDASISAVGPYYFDINSDNSFIDLADISIIANEFNRSDCSDQNNYCSYADINHDSFVDLNDLSLLADRWLQEAK